MSQQEEVMSSSGTTLGTTELRVEGMTYIWEIKNVGQLANPKIRSLCKLRSPTFTAGAYEGIAKEWHLELSNTKNDWIKCTLIQEGLESSQESLYTTRGLPSSMFSQGVNLTSSQIMEKLSGSFVYSTSIIRNDGTIQSLKEILEKSEEIDGWTLWASKFCEKRRKLGCIEFLFGENNDSSVNAIPMDYLWDKKDDYVEDNSIRLQVELLFTQNVPTPLYHSDPNQSKSPSELQLEQYKLALVEKLGQFHNNHLFSDLKLKCGHRIFPVHKLLLMAKAENFANHIFQRLALAPQTVHESSVTIQQQCTTTVTTTEEAGDHGTSTSVEVESVQVETIIIEDFEPNILDLLLQFIYKATLPEGTCIQTLANLAKIAKMYQIDSFTQYIESIVLKRGSR